MPVVVAVRDVCGIDIGEVTRDIAVSSPSTVMPTMSTVSPSSILRVSTSLPTEVIAKAVESDCGQIQIDGLEASDSTQGSRSTVARQR